ncbi:MAG: NAD-dependent epimerase/dehydratase family protein [Daejeonella sp.]
MNIFITGATGYIGQKLAMQLAGYGHVIHALARNTSKGKSLLGHENIKIFQGDILDSGSLQDAMRGCGQVYHLAALASVWNKDPSAFNRMNVQGLRNVLECCLELNIRDLLFTSTAGVVGHSEDGQPVCERSNASPELETLYEKSKLEAEGLLINYLKKGIRGIIVNPSRVYGPGLLTESNGFTRMMKMYVNGQWKIKPSNGSSIGNYVYIDDTIRGLISAMEKAQPGERYLLGGINATYNEFFRIVDDLTGKERKLYNIPLPAMLIFSHIHLFVAKISGKQPLITPPFVRKYNKHWIVSSGKAINELSYNITPLRDGISETLKWLDQIPLTADASSSYVKAD